ncbi:Uncharacterised protein [Metakosakonia massiliensis]|uniref:Uncharacterized protein n=1 Tax=Phytobacter massiliensis TaxID=1485952 RepID=A0A6N3HIY7_9ENTR
MDGLTRREGQKMLLMMVSGTFTLLLLLAVLVSRSAMQDIDNDY